MNNADTRTFHNILQSYGLQQLVKEPAHCRNHILDLDVVIIRMKEYPISNLEVTDPLLSDHKALTFHP